MHDIKGNEKKSNYVFVYEYLKNGIKSGFFDDDYIFVETEIAGQLNISRTPVREAIRMLMSEKLLVNIPSKGIVYRGLPQSDIKSVYEVAEALEGMAAFNVAKKKSKNELSELEECALKMEEALSNNDAEAWVAADEEFHKKLVSFSDNKFLSDAMENLQIYIDIIRIRYSKANAESRKSSTIQHREAVSAMNDGDADYARMLVQYHWRAVRRKLVSEL